MYVYIATNIFLIIYMARPYLSSVPRVFTVYPTQNENLGRSLPKHRSMSIGNSSNKNNSFIR